MLSGHAMVIEHSKDKTVNMSDLDLDIKSENSDQTSRLRSESTPQLVSVSLPKDHMSTPPSSAPKDKETLAREEAIRKTKEFLMIFNKELGSRTPENEKLIGDYSCAYQKEKLFVHGRMYISENYLCFYSTIFGETKKVIKLYRIKKLFKRNTAILFPNAVEIWTDKKKYFFASFIFRDQAFTALNEASEKAKSRVPSDHTSSNETSDPLGSDVEENLEEFPEDSEEDETTNKATEETSSPEDTISSSPPNHVAEASVSQTTVNNTAVVSQLTSNISNTTNSTNSTNSNTGNFPNFTPLNTVPSTNQNSPSISLNNSSNTNTLTSSSSSNINSVSSTPSLSHVSPKVSLPELPPKPNQPLLPPIRDRTLCSHFETYEKKDFHVIETLQIEPMNFFLQFFSTPDFIYEHHKREGLKDNVITPWIMDSVGCCLHRTVSFISPVKARLGPKSAPVTQTQRCCFISPGHLIIESVAETKDVPYGDSFLVITYFSINQDSLKNGSVFKMASSVKFIKSVWGVKGLIEKNCQDGAKENCINLMAFIKEKLAPLSLSNQSNSSTLKLKKEKSPLPESVLEKNTPSPSAVVSPLLSTPSLSKIPSSSLLETSSQVKSKTENDIFHIVLKELNENKLSVTIGIIFILLLLLFFSYIRNSSLQYQLDQTSLQTQILNKVQHLKFLLESQVLTKEEYLELIGKLRETPEFSRLKETIFKF